MLTRKTNRVKPKSLFAQASAKKLGAEGGNTGAGLFGSRPAAAPSAAGEQSNPFGN
jgi:hypothetical protein